MWPHPTPQDFDLKEFKSTLSEVAFSKVKAFLGKRLEKRYFKKFSERIYIGNDCYPIHLCDILHNKILYFYKL